MNWEEYLSNSSYRADNQARRQFGSDLMLAFKQKNIAEGIQWFHSVHLHARLRDWAVTFPTAAQFPNPAYAAIAEQLQGKVERVDLVNMIVAGDIETACLSAMFGQVDDMSELHHWINAERLNWIISQMKVWLGWP